MSVFRPGPVAAPPHHSAVRLAWRDSAYARAKLVVVLVVSLAVLGAACGRADHADNGSGAAHAVTSSARLLEDVPAPDPVLADGVAVAALREIYSWEPATESQGAALARARKFLGPTLLRTLDTPPPEAQAPKPSLRWSDWAAEGARVEAFTFASGEQAPRHGDPNIQQFKIGIEQTVVYPSGRREPLPPTTVIATVVRTPDGWRLDEFR
ncbi:hypothetical protein ACL02S_04265 [Nocardia sp. 004]|uniref:hypothetical protein n=1 Tax=Nocardia sp. 004 TaxID=3385978 RepID=UPI0039A11EC9